MTTSGSLMLPFHYAAARLAGRLRPKRRKPTIAELERTAPSANLADGISLIIPSRNGRELLAAQLPGIVREAQDLAHEIIVVDNGSDDGTAEWLHKTWPKVLVELSPEPLSFSCAVNCGIERAKLSHICLLNNDMLLEPGFFGPLGLAFEDMPGLFCATAQIRFPAGARREETGKAVMNLAHPNDFPVRCDEPLPGEDRSWVLYGSGGCSVYDARKLRQLGGLDEAYDPAYVEDLDLGYRAWQRGWPSVYVAGAVVEHRHRATTSRYYTDAQLELILEVNYLKFLARAVADRKLFLRLWRHALERLRQLAPSRPAALRALGSAAAIAIGGGPLGPSPEAESSFLALTDGSVAVFPGRGVTATKRPKLLVARPLVTQAARAGDTGQVLVTFTTEGQPPPAEILDVYAEVVLVRRHKGERQRPSAAFRAAIRETKRKWRLEKVRLESRQMEEYVPDCAPAEFVLM